MFNVPGEPPGCMPLNNSSIYNSKNHHAKETCKVWKQGGGWYQKDIGQNRDSNSYGEYVIWASGKKLVFSHEFPFVENIF